MLVGTRPEDWRRDFSSINENDRVLVYDFDQYEFFGPFRITKHKHGRPFEQDAWSGKFPSQARIESVGTTKSIGLQQISDEIGHSRVMRPGSSMPHAFVDGDSAANLSDLFGFPATTKPSTRPATSEPTPDPNNRLRYRTAQGFDVRSKAERAIANQLAIWGIECHYERRIPNNYFCDFYLPTYDLYIEYWGRLDDPAYSKKREEKNRVYADHKLRLLELEPEDEVDLETCLKQKLLRFGVDPLSSSGTSKQNWATRLLRAIGHWINR